MDSEYLIKRMQEEREWTQIDPFGEFISGLDDASLYTLLAALEVYKNTGLEEWNLPIHPRVVKWNRALALEYGNRRQNTEDVMENERGNLAAHIANCSRCYKGDIYGQIPEDGPLDTCDNCLPEREALAQYNEYILRTEGLT